MIRSEMLASIREMQGEWDMIIIGGGATGLGISVDAATRGYKTLLLEQHDFAKGTSSRSTKLVHGGVRYLQQGNLSLVFEALKERGILIRNAPHLVRKQPFVVPHYSWWRGMYYWFGLKLYDLLAGRSNLGSSSHLSPKKTLEKVPNLLARHLRGGILYYDGHFDDSRLAINLAETSAEAGGTLVNYMEVTGLIKSRGKIQGIKAVDKLDGEKYEIKSRVVVNATGIFTDQIRKMDDRDTPSIIAPSQGIHLVVDKHFLPGGSAIMIPQTKDGRVLFAIPWHGKAIIGTTDTAVEDIKMEPKAFDKEIDYLLKHIASYFTQKPDRSDIRSVFAGIRPLVKNGNTGDTKTAEISRDHTLVTDPSGLITIAGGKWTTYRKMAEDVVDHVSEAAALKRKTCLTKDLKIHGWDEKTDKSKPLGYYGSDKSKIQEFVEENPQLGMPLHERLPYIKAEVVWAARNEMAMTVEDFCARRTRALLLDAEASMAMAPEVARLMAEESGHGQDWVEAQVESYLKLAGTYKFS